MALYHTYRPQTFEDMNETQPDVAEFFTSALSSGKLGHIYLLVGSHGIGKTSTARILARAVNCVKNAEIKGKKSKISIPCNECDNCKAILNGSFVDVYELDAASHRGIDDVRALQEVIRLSPVQGLKKVYIIDEVHMLTTEAFNALLKTFEEPPSSRLFLLCTTELHKVPTTIQSRASIVHFAKPSDEVVAHYVSKIVKGEQSSIDNEAALELARAADGAFRDAAKLTEQLLMQHSTITSELVQTFFIGTKDVQIIQLLNAVREKDSKQISRMIQSLEQHGSNMLYVIKACIQQVRKNMRDAIIQGTPIGYEVSLLRALQQAYTETKFAPMPGLPLEMALLELLSPSKVTSVTSPATPPVSPKPQPVAKTQVEHKAETTRPTIGATIVSAQEVQMPSADTVAEIPVAELVMSPVEDVAESIVPVADAAPDPTFDQVKERWREVVTLVKDSNASVAAALRLTLPQVIEGKNLILSTTYRFHKDQIEAVKNRKLVESALYELFGVQMRLQCQLIQQSTKKKDVENLQVVQDEGLVEAALEIFGN